MAHKSTVVEVSELIDSPIITCQVCASEIDTNLTRKFRVRKDREGDVLSHEFPCPTCGNDVVIFND